MADGILNPIEQLEADLDFEVYTKQEVDALLDEKADKSDTYTKTETDALLDDKADADAVYTKTETDTLLSAKADKSTTLAGYGITDAYTKTETDTLLNGKADADNVYTKTEIDTKIPNTVGSATKPVYVNGGVITECTYELNKTVPANAVFTDTTYSAGNGLNLSGTSFSAKAGANVTVDGNGINVNGSGVVASADSGLISGGTAYTELRPTLDGTWVKNAQTTAINLQKLEGGIEYLYALLSRQYDQLKKYINGNYYDYDTDTDSKYTKTVLAGAMPYASLDSVGGKTLVMNQLIYDPTMTDASNWQNKISPSNFTTSVANNVLTFKRTNGGSNVQIYCKTNSYAPIIGHKYFVSATISADVAIQTARFYVGSGGNAFEIFTTPTQTNEFIECSALNVNTIILQCAAVYLAVDNSIYVSNFVAYDLTLMYGAGNEPTTVEEFQQMFPSAYYPYNAGTLLSAGVTEVVSKDSNNATLQTISIPTAIRNLEGYGWSAGQVYNYIDFERKVFVQNVGAVDLGTLTWTYNDNVYGKYFTTTINEKKDGLANLLCSRYEVFGAGVASITSPKGIAQSQSQLKVVYVVDPDYTNPASFKTAMSGTHLFYELQTPIETDISAYLTDDNLISVESGGTLTFENQHGDDYRIDVPSAETYMIDLQSAL